MLTNSTKTFIFCISLACGSYGLSYLLEKPYHKDFYLKSALAHDETSNKKNISVDYSKIKKGQLERAEKYKSSDWRLGELDGKRKDIYQYIADHTFKLDFSNGQGTGWIMDFEMPAVPSKYPTTWYLATNIHVVSGIKKTDIYETKFPQFTKYGDETKLSISQQGIAPGEEYTMQWDNDERTQSSYVWNDRQEEKVEDITYSLFYHAWNFLGDRHDKHGYKIDYQDYYKDFAVVEVKFSNEELAKRTTHNYFDKYYKNPTNGNKPVNLFSKEWLYSDKAPSGLDNVYAAGYSKAKFDYNASDKVSNDGIPINDDDVTTTISTLLNKQIDSKWDFYFLKDNDDDIIPGHIIIIPDDINNPAENESWGYEYLIADSGLIHGSSGSMLIDENKNLLGIMKTIDGRFNLGGADLLKSEGIFDGKKIISPKYDLIRGVEGQPMSYKSQLEKFHPNMTTYLTSINWGRPKTAEAGQPAE